MGVTPRSATIVLSSNSITPYEIYSAAYGIEWPVGAEAHTVFYNTDRAVLADVTADDVSAATIRYLFRPDGTESVNDVPAGARFESFIETDDGPLKLRYGVVQRAEARFATRPDVILEPGPREFTDTFVRQELGFRWEPVYGSCKIYVNNPIQKTPIGVGPDTNKLLGKPGAIRYYKGLAGDSAELTITINMPAAIGASNGKSRAIVCGDQNMTSGLAIEVDSIADQIHMARVTGQDQFTYVGSAASDTLVDGASYTMRYNNLNDTLAIYKGASLSPMVSPWVDTSHVVAHGKGYRYLLAAFHPTILETGPLISGWAAKDTV
jgi:hypothetical protein